MTALAPEARAAILARVEKIPIVGTLNMDYMVIETFKPGKKEAVYARYGAKGRMLPAGLHYVHSWVETDGDRCFQLMRTDDRQLLDRWIRKWQDLVDFEIVPITDSPTRPDVRPPGPGP